MGFAALYPSYELTGLRPGRSVEVAFCSLLSVAWNWSRAGSTSLAAVSMVPLN